MSGHQQKESLFSQLTKIVNQGLSHQLAIELLRESSQTPGFCIRLMEIIDRNSFPIQIKQLALQQLQAHIRLNWLQGINISHQQKRYVMHSIIASFVKSPFNLIKLFEKLLKIIFVHQYRNWSPFPIILHYFKQSQYIRNVLSIALTVQNAFDLIEQPSKQQFFNFLEATLQQLLKIVKNVKDQQISYLCLQFYHKAMTNYFTNFSFQKHFLTWLPFLSIYVNLNKNNLHQQREINYQRYIQNIKELSTQIYFHFIKLRVKKELSNQIDDIVLNFEWHSGYTNRSIQILIQQVYIITNKQIRVRQLQCVLLFIKKNKKLLVNHNMQFLYNIISKDLSSQSKELVRKIWVQLLGLGIDKNLFGQQNANHIFDQNIKYLEYILNKDCQQGLFLLNSIQTWSPECQKAQQAIVRLLQQYVIQNLRSQNPLIRCAAFDTMESFHRYHKYLNIQMVLQIILPYIVLKDDYNLSIKAASLFTVLVPYINQETMDLPFTIQSVVQAYISLCSPQQVSTIWKMNRMVNYICLFAFQAIEAIIDGYIWENDHKIHKQQHICLDFIRLIKKIINEIQPSSKKIMDIGVSIKKIIIFTFENKIDYEFQEVFQLLQTYLFKTQIISQQLWFVYDLIIKYLIGNIQRNWDPYKLLLSQQGEQFTKFITIQTMQYQQYRANCIYFDICLPSLTLFFQVISANQYNRIVFQKKLNYFLQFAYKIFSRLQQPQEIIEPCISLMISFLQQFKRSQHQSIYIRIWQFVRLNIVKGYYENSTTLLIGMLLWTAPNTILTISRRQNLHEKLVKLLIQSIHLICLHEHQRARIILGLNALIDCVESRQDQFRYFTGQLKLLYRTCCDLVRINAVQYIRTYQYAGYLKNVDHNDEKFDRNYVNIWRIVDEIEDFQIVTNRIRLQNNHLYQQLILFSELENNFQTNVSQAIRIRRQKREE